MKDGEELSPTIKEAKDLAEVAKVQAVKFGFLSFIHAPNISEQNNENAQKMRDNLQGIWNQQKLNEDVVEYLGEKLIEEIKRIIAILPAEQEGPQPKKRCRISRAE